MDRHYSTLELAEHDETARAPELVKHDETARAPERDYDATAFELDPSALAPEVVPDTTPEVFYDGTLPEAHNNEKPIKDRLHVTRPARKWPWIVIALVLAAAIAVGVSVGIWHHRGESLQKPSGVSSPPAPNITHAPQYILNDTSLAAMSLPNGDRQLFFQDNTGTIQRAVYAKSNGQWTTSPNLNVSTDPSFEPSPNPKRYTPLAVAGPTLGRDMSLYFVSENHVVTSRVLAGDSWRPGADFGNYSTAVDTRSLSISLFPFTNDSSALHPKENTTTNVALLFFENPNGDVSALLYRCNYTVHEDSSIASLQDQWINITSQDSKALPKEFHNAPGFNYSDALYSLPADNTTYSRTLYEADPMVVYNTSFFSAPNLLEDVGLMFYSPLGLMTDALSPPAGNRFIIAGYTIGLHGSGNFTLLQQDSTSPSKDYDSIHQSDIAGFGNDLWSAIWINGTQPVLIASGVEPSPTLPRNEFPFKRLASVTSTDGSATWLYHQMNGTTFAEEQWDETTQIWLRTEYITVSDD